MIKFVSKGCKNNHFSCWLWFVLFCCLYLGYFMFRM